MTADRYWCPCCERYLNSEDDAVEMHYPMPDEGDGA